MFGYAVICSLYYYHQSHPANLILLALFTACLSLSVGMTCAFTKGKYSFVFLKHLDTEYFPELYVCIEDISHLVTSELKKSKF